VDDHIRSRRESVLPFKLTAGRGPLPEIVEDLPKPQPPDRLPRDGASKTIVALIFLVAMRRPAGRVHGADEILAEQHFVNGRACSVTVPAGALTGTASLIAARRMAEVEPEPFTW
jgi:RecG-like helicase